MIIVTRLGGQPMAVNPDLIEKAEATPDTVLTLVDGHKLVIRNSVEEVVDLIRSWRASVAAEAFAVSAPLPAATHFPVRASRPGSDPDEALTAQGGSSVSLARVLRMPAREE